MSRHLSRLCGEQGGLSGSYDAIPPTDHDGQRLSRTYAFRGQNPEGTGH
jgi:hypothetical protein